MSGPRTVKELSTSFDEVIKAPDIVDNITKSIKGILTVTSVILETGGKPGWHKEFNKHSHTLGQTLDEKDEEMLQPLVSFITETTPNKQLTVGGGEDDFDINSPFYALINKVKELDARFDGMAYLRRFEEGSDDRADFKPFKPLEFAPVIGPTVKASGFGETPVPFRLIISVCHTLLDVLRLSLSLPGFDKPFLRKTFSVALAAFEFLRGQWKQALLSAAGIISQPAMYAGFFGKVFLNIFSLISPSMQDDIIYGSFSVTKSLIVGILISIFQATATLETRKKVMNFFKEIAERNQEIDDTLEEKGLPIQPSNRKPDMDHWNRIQAAAQDRTITCSSDYQGVIETAKGDIILKLIFQMMNMPITEEDLNLHCAPYKNYIKDNKYPSIKELVVIEAEKAKGSAPPPGDKESNSEEQNPEEQKQEQKQEQKPEKPTPIKGGSRKRLRRSSSKKNRLKKNTLLRSTSISR